MWVKNIKLRVVRKNGADFITAINYIGSYHFFYFILQTDYSSLSDSIVCEKSSAPYSYVNYKIIMYSCLVLLFIVFSFKYYFEILQTIGIIEKSPSPPGIFICTCLLKILMIQELML